MPRQHRFDLLAILGTAVVTLLLETALAERKFGIFTGGFGATKVLDAPLELLAFSVGAALSQLLLLALAFVAIRALHRRPARPALVRLDFAALAGGGLVAWTIAKFEVLSYFSDAISFRLIANLGGGSLYDAFLYALSDSGLVILGLAGAVAAWAVARWWLVRRARIGDSPGLRLKRPLLGLALLLPAIVFATNRLPDARYAANRFTAYNIANGLLAQATDFDRDGYGWFTAQLDPAPFDAARHPFALDVPGDGIDQDGFGGDFAFAGPDPIPTTPRLAAGRHLVVIVLESTRADVIGKRVNGRPVAPNLTALAAAGSRWPFAYSHVGFTTASLKSLFSGQLDPKPGRKGLGSSSLFRDLKANGYRIGIFSGQPETFGDIASTVGMAKAADVYVDANTLKDERAFSFAAQGSLLVDEGKLLREFDRRMGAPVEWGRPHFVYFNFQSAHFPYHHPGMSDPLGIVPLDRGDIAAANATRVAETYYNAVAYADRRIGEVIARLKALGVWDDTVLIVTGDHGEALFDGACPERLPPTGCRGGTLGHGHVLDPQQTHIPFVVSVPGLATPQPLGLKDMRAILLHALGGPAAPPRTRPAFLHIGPLDTPTAIGIVAPGGVFTTMTLETEEVWLSDRKLRARYQALSGAERARADALIDEWARQRWQAHIAGR